MLHAPETARPLVTVEHVSLADDALGFVDLPAAPSGHDTYALQIAGWAIGRAAPIRAIEVACDGAVVAHAPVLAPRPDVAQAHPDCAGADRSGFALVVNVLRLPLRFELEVRVVHEDGTAALLGRIAGAREPIRTPYAPVLQPIALTTVGRSGSMWLCRLLDQHPAVIAYRPLLAESRVSAYWLSALLALSEPGSYWRQLDAVDFTSEGWWLGRDASSAPPPAADLPQRRWVERAAVEDLAAVAQQRIDAWYTGILAAEGCRGVRAFAEKQIPGHPVLPLLHELYPRAREVILVRDPRDVVCSIEAFNARRGQLSFGREAGQSMLAYLEATAAGTRLLLRAWQERAAGAHLVRYEDLVREPVATVSAMLGYLGLDHDRHLVQRMVTAAEQPVPGDAEHRTAASPARSIGRWREELDPALHDDARRIFVPLLEGFGYSDEAAG
jgi:hypothetical protein